jgi:hypothetical protein
MTGTDMRRLQEAELTVAVQAATIRRLEELLRRATTEEKGEDK